MKGPPANAVAGRHVLQSLPYESTPDVPPQLAVTLFSQAARPLPRAPPTFPLLFDDDDQAATIGGCGPQPRPVPERPRLAIWSSNRMRVLLVEDQPRAAQMIAKGLREQAYAVDLARTGPDALYQAAVTEYDAIVLDVMLPGLDGFEVCRQLRRQGSNVPILMLTARDAVDARIAGLDSGADDYLVKPFDFGELLARLRAVIRRGRLPMQPSVVAVGGLRLDLRARLAFRRERPITLTRREFALLEFLVLHAGAVVGRGAIAEHVWDAPFETMSNVIDVMIQRLRRKIDDPDGPSLITTRRGEGYMLAPTTDAARE
jgi:DNA-binding response OmpR family regulator